MAGMDTELTAAKARIDAQKGELKALLAGVWTRGPAS